MNAPLDRLPLAAVLGAALIGGSSSPEPVATDSPLKEIGHVRVTTPFCKAALSHTLSAIAVLIENDGRIDEAQGTMRSVDADPSPVVRYSRWETLNREYAGLRTAAVSGRVAIRLLKSEAASAPADEQTKALKVLANALDGALARQNKIGDVVGRLAQYIDNHPPFDEAARDRNNVEQSLRPPTARRMPTLEQANVFATKTPISTVANRDAGEVDERKSALARDEDDAATKIDAAFSGC